MNPLPYNIKYGETQILPVPDLKNFHDGRATNKGPFLEYILLFHDR